MSARPIHQSFLREIARRMAREALQSAKAAWLSVLVAACLLAGSSQASAGDKFGACCSIAGFCTIETQADCEADGGTYQGDGTTCQPLPCPRGACCDAGTGLCDISSPFFCEEGYQGDGTVCDPNPCPQPPMGACCDEDDGTCELLPEAACRELYLGDDTLCDPNPCPVPGACCSFGSCYVTTEPVCQLDEGEFQGDGTTCDPNPCVSPPQGACCDPSDGSCVLTFEEVCSDDYQGDDTVCVPNPCPQPQPGACCFEDGSCILLSEDDCDSGGDYEGDGTTCEPNPCQQPVAVCCLPDGTCTFRTESECVDAGGEFLPNDSVCEPGVTCDIGGLGACCLGEGVCELLSETACDSQVGEYNGEGTTCEPGLCEATSDVGTGLGTSTRLEAIVRPNPARGNANVEWSSPIAGTVTLTIHDATGRTVRRVLSEPVSAGLHQARWDGRDASGNAMPTGVYYYRLSVAESGDQVTSKIYFQR